MIDDERASATTPPRLALIMTSTLLGALIAGVAVIGSNAIEQPLTENAVTALRSSDLSGVGVRFDGREAFLTPTGAAPAEVLRAEKIVAGLEGVRWVTVVAPDAALAPTLSITQGTNGVVSVDGDVATEQEASVIQDAAVTAFGPGTVVHVTVTDGVATAPWADTATDLFTSLAEIDDLAFTLDPDGATVSGSVVDPSATQSAVEAALEGIPLQADLTQAGPGEAETASINGTVIRFVADSVTLNKKARAEVARLAEVLLLYPDVEVSLTGHIAIPVSTQAEAVAFSQRRAQAVADALIAAGVPAENLQIVGAGSSQPVGDNATEAGAAANRRVTVLIMEGS